MRLDLFLKISRLVPRRTLAQQLCDAGLVEVSGTRAKASKEIKAGDEIRINRRNRRTVVEVIQVPATKQVSKNSAGELYRLIGDTVVADDPD